MVALSSEAPGFKLFGVSGFRGLWVCGFKGLGV